MFHVDCWQTCEIGKWGDGPTYDDNGNSTLPCDQDLLWFRTAKGEVAHFVDSKRVMPGLIDTLMCGCGGNVYAVAVTSKRLIVQNDKRCMFGKTVLTTNEDSIFVENIHKAALFTDGSLNLGVTVLHSFDMLRGGFNWIFFGLLVDIILEWKPTWMKLLGDARLQVCSCRRRRFTSDCIHLCACHSASRQMALNEPQASTKVPCVRRRKVHMHSIYQRVTRWALVCNGALLGLQWGVPWPLARRH